MFDEFKLRAFVVLPPALSSGRLKPVPDLFKFIPDEACTVYCQPKARRMRRRSEEDNSDD